MLIALALFGVCCLGCLLWLIRRTDHYFDAWERTFDDR